MSDGAPKRKGDKGDAADGDDNPPKRSRKEQGAVSGEEVLRTLKTILQRYPEVTGPKNEAPCLNAATWGHLIPQKPGSGVLLLKGPTYVFGKNNSLACFSCTTPPASRPKEKMLCKFILNDNAPYVEVLSSTMELYVNHVAVVKGSQVTIRSGDELHMIFNHRSHSYVFVTSCRQTDEQSAQKRKRVTPTQATLSTSSSSSCSTATSLMAASVSPVVPSGCKRVDEACQSPRAPSSIPASTARTVMEVSDGKDHEMDTNEEQGVQNSSSGSGDRSANGEQVMHTLFPKPVGPGLEGAASTSLSSAFVPAGGNTQPAERQHTTTLEEEQQSAPKKSPPQVSAMLTPSASAPNLLLSTPSANGTINPEHSGSTSPHPTSLSPTFPLEGASAQEPTQQSLLLRFGDSLVLKETPAAPDPARPPGGSQAEDREFAGTMQEPTEVAAGTPDSASSGVQTDWTVFQSLDATAESSPRASRCATDAVPSTPARSSSSVPPPVPSTAAVSRSGIFTSSSAPTATPERATVPTAVAQPADASSPRSFTLKPQQPQTAPCPLDLSTWPQAAQVPGSVLPPSSPSGPGPTPGCTAMPPSPPQHQAEVPAPVPAEAHRVTPHRRVSSTFTQALTSSPGAASQPSSPCGEGGKSPAAGSPLRVHSAPGAVQAPAGVQPAQQPQVTAGSPAQPRAPITAGAGLTAAELKDKLVAEINPQVLKPDAITTSLASPAEFPYYISEPARQLLLHSVYLHLLRPEFCRFSPFSHSHAGLTRNLLLSGPPGSEVYQEVLARSLAKTFGAFFLAFDRTSLKSAPSSADDAPPPGARGCLTPVLNPSPGPGITSTNPAASMARGFKKGDRVIYAPCSLGLPGISSAPVPCAPGVHTASLVVAQGPTLGARGRVVLAFEDNPRRQKVGVCFDQPVPGGSDLGGLCPAMHGFFANVAELVQEDDEHTAGQACIIQALFEVVAVHQPCVVFLRDAENLCFGNAERFLAFKQCMEQISTPCVILARSVKQDRKVQPKVNISGRLGNAPDLPSLSAFAFEQFGLPDAGPWAVLGSPDLTSIPEDVLLPIKGLGAKRAIDVMRPRVFQRLFPMAVAVSPLPDEGEGRSPQEVQAWKDKLAEDSAFIKAQAATKTLTKVMDECQVVCPALCEALAESLSSNCPFLSPSRFKAFGLLGDTQRGPISLEAAKQIVQWAVSHQLQTQTAVMLTPTDRSLVLYPESLAHAVQLYFKSEATIKGTSKVKEALQTDNEFEKRLLTEVVQPSAINVAFDQIGSHEKVKGLLREVVLLPLTRPGLFSRSSLLRPCKGILLFGPPGTGKTMLAKAIATEARAHFMNISMSVVTSKWFGEAEKLVAAVFSLARKLAPCIIFIDEVDAMLGRRSSEHEHEAMRKLKNEFMAAWDGLKSQDFEQVIVLAATNRPGDLDEAVLRRMPRRILVDVPNFDNRKAILQVVLKDEALAADVQLELLAQMTAGYSGSDLKQMCIAAAYRPVREYLKKESGPLLAPEKQAELDETATLRAVNLQDFREAVKEVGGSVNEDAVSIAELRKWNEAYGDGGKRQARDHLTYFM